MSQDFINTLQEWTEISLHRTMHEFGQFMRGQGISMPQISVLMRLHHHGDCPVSEIGRHLAVTNAAASQLVQRLVEQGYLARTEKPGDRRVRHVSLTDNGRALVQRAVEARRVWIDQIAGQFDEAAQAGIRAAMLALIGALREGETPIPHLEEKS